MSRFDGERLLEFRRESGLTLHQVQKKTGLCGSYIQKLEHGVKSNPSTKAIRKLENGLGLPKGYFTVRLLSPMEDAAAVPVVPVSDLLPYMQCIYQAVILGITPQALMKCMAPCEPPR